MRQAFATTSLETLVPEGVFIYSRTDLRGMIVEANEAFAEISGYEQSAMIGRPHNLVRHPDMPAAAFADLWRTLKAGQTWRGVVKNRRSDGGFYWVIANVSPVRDNGEIVGYQSVRSRPTREQVAAAAAAYERIGRGDTSLRLERGQVLRSRPRWREKLAGVDSQLNLIAVFLLASGVLGLLAGRGWVAGLLGEATAVAALLVGGWVLLGLRPGLNRDLKAIRAVLLEAVSRGRLDIETSVQRQDGVGEIGRLACALVASMQATVQVMTVSLRQVADTAVEVGGRMRDIEQSAQVQNQATSEAAAAVEQLTVSINEVAASAVETHSVADATRAVADSGEQVMSAASRSMGELADVVNATADQVGALSDTTGEIGGIAAVIKEIADQTNLLALNAAIEAARAGESGRGFAVVADEVRKLAERTREATAHIDQLIVATRRDSELAVGGMHQGAARVGDSVGLVEEARDALLGINRQMGRTAVMVTDISRATAEQSRAMGQLAQNVERVAEMTARNVSGVAQTQRRVGALQSLLANLDKTVRQYQL